MRTRSHSSRNSLLVSWLLVSVTLPAFAEKTAKFEDQVAAAQWLYLAHDYEGAIRQLERAYEMKPLNRLLFNLGMAHRKLGHTKEALSYFERYRDRRTAADAVVPVERYIAELREKATEESRDEPVPTPAESSPLPRVQMSDGTPPATSAPQTTPAFAVTSAPTAPKSAARARRRSSAGRWWIWTLAGALTAGVIVGVAVGTTQERSPTPAGFVPNTPTIGPNAFQVGY